MFKNRLVKVVVVMAVSALALGTSVQSSQAGKSEIQLYVGADTNIQDLWVKTLIPAFTAAYPDFTVKVTFDLHGANAAQQTAKIIAATTLRKDPQVDLIDAGFTVQLGLAGLLWRPTPGLVPNIKMLSKSVLKAGSGGIPYRASSVLLAYNSLNVKTPPKTIDELLVWIKANPGKFTYNVPSGGGSGYAFAQTIVDKFLSESDRTTLVQEANKELQAKWAPGLELLRSLNKYTYGQNGTYPSNNAETLKNLSTGLIDMGTVWSDQFVSAIKAGTMPSHIKVVGVTNPALTGGAAYLGIPRGSNNRAGAYLLANFVLSPAAQNLIVSGNLNGMPVIPISKLDPKVAATLGSVDVQNLRPTYLSPNANDLRNAWALTVPGK